MFGFTESLNLSVATAMVIQRLFMMAPDMRGQMSDTERRSIRYYHLLSTSNPLFFGFSYVPSSPLLFLFIQGGVV